MKLSAFALLVFCTWANGQLPPPRALVAFRMDRSGAPVTSYTLTVQADGSTVYQVSYPSEAPKYSPYAATQKALPNTEATVKTMLSAQGTGSLFERLRAAKGFSAGCASKAKHIADTGTKTLTFTSSEGTASCVYNYTEDKNVTAITSFFEGVAATLDEGRKLETDHRYDRLALDAEMDYLVAAAKNGTAVEFGAIAPTLRAIADDPQVLERVRKRAVNLLAQAAMPGMGKEQ